LPRSGCVAVCDSASNGVDVFSVEGAFVRRVAKVRENTAIACTAFDEIVMTDFYGRVFVANERGDVVKQLRHGVAVFNDTVLVHTIDGACVELA
jgi:predicted amidohydrolase